LVKKTLPKICLHIVGDGTKLREIKKLMDTLGVEENVVLHGFLTEREINHLYLACDMVVVPSRNEPFGITVLEAMRAGRPLIVSNRGALPELVKHNYNGIVVELKPEAFAQAILTLIKDKNLVFRISEANKLAVKFYDWGKISEEYIHMYETLIDNSFNH
jgi:glycosyltransferase involved in cell wall biosynthesis